MTSDGIIPTAFRVMEKKIVGTYDAAHVRNILNYLQEEIVAEINKTVENLEEQEGYVEGTDLVNRSDVLKALLGTESEEKDAAYFVKHSIPNDMKFEDTESEAKKIKYDTESTIAAKITNKPAPVEPQPKKSDPAADPDCDCSDCNN